MLALAYGYTAYRLLPFSTMENSLRVVAITAVIACVLLGPLSQFIRIFYEDSPWSDAIAWIAYVTFGFFSMTLFFVIVRDLGLVVYDLASSALFSPAKIGELASERTSWIQAMNLSILGLTGGLTVYGYFKARGLVKINRVNVPIDDLPADLDGFTIAQISDLHVGPTIKEKFVTKVVDMVNSLNADMVAITGDLVDGSVPKLRKHVQPLADLRSRYGTFYVTGNHEYYSGALQWIGEARRLGMTVLLNDHQILEHNSARIAIGGVTDYTAGSFYPNHRSDPQKAFENSPEGVIRILLAHQPKSIFKAVEAGIHLQLSGHTHGGQFFPGNLFVPLQQPMVRGLHRYESAQVFISCGTGYWGPPLRVGTSSEIALITLVRRES
ncbi:MAG TPA: serine/threonine protein phosphatase [Leptospiraceae bacterium]|nr:serine/threonine protein phosphatase [Spirochaetaceae bacterium]HBS06484.1 serine/threonine protein phosphatase [Leptospiraceae bacterium]